MWIVGGLIIILTISSQSLHISNAKFYDQSNREIYFHGVSVVVKVPPYLPLTDRFDQNFSFSEIDMKTLKDWGFNSIRLGLMWAGVEPEKDTYNETYLQEMVKIVNKAGEYGIYTLIDFHQDILAEKFCGDGVPTWLIDELEGYKTFPYPASRHKYPLNSSGLPDYNNCTSQGWARYYFSLDVGRMFAQLYKHGTRLNTKFMAYWEKIAQTFRNNPNVIAYELINEPFVGRAIQQPWLLIPSFAERIYFQNFYDELAHRIRKIDTKTPICFQPVTFDNGFPIGFSHPPGGNKYKNLSALCYHYYTPPALGLGTIDHRVQDAKRLGIPSLLSEMYGSQNSADEIRRAQSLLQSWMLWGYKDFGKTWGSSKTNDMTLGGFFFQNGTAIPKIISVISVTYLQLVAGKLLSSTYTDSTKQFVGVYEATPKGTSILYINEQYNYPNGYSIDVFPRGSISLKQVGEGYVGLYYGGNQIKRIMVTVIPS